MFTKDSRAETFLSQMGVIETRYSNNVKFPDLKRGWKETNMSRPVPIREDAVLEYSALMESGSPAPAPILHVTDNGLAVLDGVQRLAAVELLGSTSFSAYVIQCDSDNLVSAINVLANARLQGRPEPPEWTRKRAVEVLVIKRGLSIDEVARMGGWKPSQVKATANSLLWGKTIAEIGGPTLSDSMLQVIESVTTIDEILKCPKPVVAMLNIIKQAKLSAVDAVPYVNDFFERIAKPSKRFEIYADRLAEVKREPEIVARIKGRKGGTTPNDVQLRRTLKTAITILDHMLVDCSEVVYVDEFYKLIGDIEKRLKKFPNHSPDAVSVAVPADRWQQ